MSTTDGARQKPQAPVIEIIERGAPAHDSESHDTGIVRPNEVRLYPPAVQVADTFRRRMRELRELNGMSQALLADYVSVWLGTKVDSTAIVKMEKGDRAIKLAEAWAIAVSIHEDLTVDEMLRPTLPVEQQIMYAEGNVQIAEGRAAAAIAEAEAARAKLEELRRLASTGGDGGPEV